MDINLTSASLKRSFSQDEIIRIVTGLGSDSPRASPDGRALIFQTICHNQAHQGSYKLFYYTESGLFHCYTQCGDSFDVFELIQRSKGCNFYHALLFIQNALGVVFERKVGIQPKRLDDWDIIEKYRKRERVPQASLPAFPETILDAYYSIPPVAWLNDHITAEAMKQFNIRYGLVENEIVIPHYDINGRLIGIRSRTLDADKVAAGYKYMPTRLEEQDYRHQLRNNLYGLNQTKDAIQRIGKAMVFESEKSVLQCAGYYGQNNFSTAVCGSHISLCQRDMLLSLGVREVFLAFDKEYQEAYTPQSDAYAEKILTLASLFTPYVTTYVLWDVEGLLGYKDSPSDKGKDVLEALMRNKFEIKTEDEVKL